MAQTIIVHGRSEDSEPTYGEELVELVRIVLVAGLSVGIVLIGLGSRIAMLVLRLTSPDSVDGVESDDGFTIGQVTLGGTYNLVLVGAAVGVIGAVAYVAVAPWLIGPQWFRYLTVSLTAGVLGGAMLIHSDGIDFTALKPLGLAVGLFIALPCLVGFVLPAVVDWAADENSWPALGQRRAIVPLVLVALVVPSLFIVVPVLLIVAAVLPARRALLRPLQGSAVGRYGVRAVFLTVPIASAVALGQDLSELF